MNDGQSTESVPNNSVNVHSCIYGKRRLPLSDIIWKGIIEGMGDMVFVLSYIGSLACILQERHGNTTTVKAICTQKCDVISRQAKGFTSVLM